MSNDINISLVFHSKNSFTFNFEFTLWCGKKKGLNALLICAMATGVTFILNIGMPNDINISLVIHSNFSHLTLNLHFGVAKKGWQLA
jgi:hypothetical protein